MSYAVNFDQFNMPLLNVKNKYKIVILLKNVQVSSVATSLFSNAIVGL